MRGATSAASGTSGNALDFNPRSSCEERRRAPERVRPTDAISIHAPHARSDTTQQIREYNTGTFQSTLLMRGATSVSTTPWPRLNHFNPRSSCEERHYFDNVPVIEYLFQSTLLMRGATCSVFRHRDWRCISIHAPHARSDCMQCVCNLYASFQSTLLMRGATTCCIVTAMNTLHFNPRSSFEERQNVGLSM